MHRSRFSRGAPVRLLGFLFLITGLLALGCSKDASNLANPSGGTASLSSRAADGAAILDQRGDTPPAGVVQVASQGGHAHLDLYPYTGAGFDGTPVDPINLLFVGTACPRTVRAALMKLDGDRHAFGFPDAPPFNQRWGDAFGDVQTAYAEGMGWTGSVIQLALGDYGPVRVHLRLFRTAGAGDDAWTMGAAHFEVLIPGTADHWVLSWELARQLVVADLLRAGLVVGAPELSPPITQTPSYRTIPPVIYNGLPPDLRAAIGGPPDDQTSDVPVPNDGKAAVVFLGDIPDMGVPQSQSFTITYGQAIPKPICADGPYDYVYVEGPVQFMRTTTIDPEGSYVYEAHASGRLTVTPIDVTTTPPTPVGAPFTAIISEDQSGTCGMLVNRVDARSKRIAAIHGGAERVTADLKVGMTGEKKYRVFQRCLEPEP